MNVILLITVCIGSYFLGSVSGAIWLSKRMSKGDVRNQGSGNAGATNMARVYGVKAGLAVLAIDMMKAAIAMAVGELFMGEPGMCVGGISCIVGHCYPAVHGFRGGKGVSVGAAVALMIDWRVFTAAILCFFIVAFAGRKVSLASMCAGIAIIVSSLMVGVSAERLVLGSVCVAIVILRHRDNIVRLLNGTEPDFKAGKTDREVSEKNK